MADDIGSDLGARTMSQLYLLGGGGGSTPYRTPLKVNTSSSGKGEVAFIPSAYSVILGLRTSFLKCRLTCLSLSSWSSCSYSSSLIVSHSLLSSPS